MKKNKKILRRVRAGVINASPRNLPVINIKSAFFFLLVLLSVPVSVCRAEIVFYDDLNRAVRLKEPAQRIISLTPHITELLFAAGAGEKITGTVNHSDYPEEAKLIPKIGDAVSVDIEKIIALKPDVIIVWATGTNRSILESLGRLDFPLYYAEAATLEQIAGSLVKLGKLADTEAAAREKSDHFLKQLNAYKHSYSSSEPLNVFYQFWHQPIFTINKDHLINDVIRLCGGHNIFSNLPSLTPVVDIESVLAGNPDIIIVSGQSDTPPQWLDLWREWPEIRAVKDNQLYSIPPDFLLRHTLRVLNGVALMCDYIDRARNRARAP